MRFKKSVLLFLFAIGSIGSATPALATSWGCSDSSGVGFRLGLDFRLKGLQSGSIQISGVSAAVDFGGERVQGEADVVIKNGLFGKKTTLRLTAGEGDSQVSLELSGESLSLLRGSGSKGSDSLKKIVCLESISL